MKGVIILFLAIVFTACDPARVLVLKANRNESITLYAHSNILPGNRDNDNKKIIITVPYSDTMTHYEQVLLYGLGNWPKDFIAEYARDIDSIIITSPSKKSSFTTHNAITDYLLKSRHGLFKNIIEIKTK